MSSGATQTGDGKKQGKVMVLGWKKEDNRWPKRRGDADFHYRCMMPDGKILLVGQNKGHTGGDVWWCEAHDESEEYIMGSASYMHKSRQEAQDNIMFWWRNGEHRDVFYLQAG